jgi:hypothetical protein
VTLHVITASGLALTGARVVCGQKLSTKTILVEIPALMELIQNNKECVKIATQVV